MFWQYVVASALLAVVTFAASLVLITVLLVNLPATFFLDSHSRQLWIDRHPVIRWSGVFLKNGAGWFLVLLGGVLIVPGVPGQGVLTVLVGLALIDFPGKRKFERRLLSHPRLRTRIDQLRHRFGKQPLLLEEAAASSHTDDARGRDTADND